MLSFISTTACDPTTLSVSPPHHVHLLIPTQPPPQSTFSQALALLANLLMKDYVKWRGALFHRFALALVDEAADVRRLAEYLLGDTLATKVGG